MKITEEMMGNILPQNIIDSEELSLASKKVLAAMLDWYKNSKANQTHIVIISNKVLCAIAGVGGNSLQESLRELDSYNLVTRTIGTKLGDASKYIIHFKNLIKSLKKMSFEEMFSKELESLENPISTIVENSIVETSKEETSRVNNSRVNNIVEKNIEEHTRKVNSYEEFKQMVVERLNGKNEDDLTKEKEKITRELNQSKIGMTSTQYNRFILCINNVYQGALATIAV